MIIIIKQWLLTRWSMIASQNHIILGHIWLIMKIPSVLPRRLQPAYGDLFWCNFWFDWFKYRAFYHDVQNSFKMMYGFTLKEINKHHARKYKILHLGRSLTFYARYLLLVLKFYWVLFTITIRDNHAMECLIIWDRQSKHIFFGFVRTLVLCSEIWLN